MEKKISIDVVIPSFRLDPKYIIPLLSLEIPQNVEVFYFLVSDNPNIQIREDLLRHISGSTNISLLINETNRGASFSRNRGFHAGTSDWILLLDDDITAPPDLLFKYINGIIAHPEATGFVGVVDLPKPINAFTEALMAEGSFDIFSVANKSSDSIWGATANVGLARKKIQTIEFSSLFPKAGGGEDVDFFLNVYKKNSSQPLICLPQAKVSHPWWNDGKTNFVRSFRYGVGNSILVSLHTEFVYRSFMNMAELSFAFLLLSLVFILFDIKISIYLALIALPTLHLSKILAYKIRGLIKKTRETFEVSFYKHVIDLATESGLLYGNLKKMNFKNVGLRFDFSTNKGKKYRIIHLNTTRIITCGVFITLLTLFSFWYFKP